MSNQKIIHELRESKFNQETTRKLLSHPYLVAAQNGTLTLAQRQAFVKQQYHIQLSDAKSFAVLAGHSGFNPKTLTGTQVPTPTDKMKDNDLFQFLLGGELYASSLLLNCAKSVGLPEESMLVSSKQAAKAQAYPSYWARIALSNQRAAGAAACAINFPAWGEMCRKLNEALLQHGETYGYNTSTSEEGLEFIKFFATPIDNLDEMAVTIMDEEQNDITYDELEEVVRMLQEYEIMFWDACYEAKE